MDAVKHWFVFVTESKHLIGCLSVCCLQHDRAPVASVPGPAEGRLCGGATQHHLQPRECQQGWVGHTSPLI